MPLSPLTRGMAIIFVAGFAILLLWPNDIAYQSGSLLVGPGLILLGAFTASAVANAAPFNDRSFHRCLPPGDRSAFLRVIRIHLLVSAGIALAVLVYCLLFNFGWPSISFGLVASILPLWAFSAAIGSAASIGSAGRAWRSAAWAGIFLAPLGSIYLVHFFKAKRPSIPYIFPEHYLLSPHRTVILLAAFAYPLIWWLVAVKRRKALGLILCTLTSAMLPVVYQTGYFFPIASFEPGASLPPQSSLGLVRKPLPEEAQAWIKLSDMLEPTGLREGEVAHLQSSTSLYADKGRRVGSYSLSAAYVQDQQSPLTTGPDSIPPFMPYISRGSKTIDERWIYVGNVGGRLMWGEKAVWENLRGKIPPHESFHYWNSIHGQAGSLQIRTPDAVGSMFYGSQVLPRYQQTREPFWSVYLSGPIRWELAGECSTAEGGTLRLAQGVIKIETDLDSQSNPVLRMKRYRGIDWTGNGEGPWFGLPPETTFFPPMVILVDASGKDAFALDNLDYEGRDDTTLGYCDKFSLWRISTEPGDRGPDGGREAWRNGRLYVFTGVTSESYRQLGLPPP